MSELLKASDVQDRFPLLHLLDLVSRGPIPSHILQVGTDTAVILELRSLICHWMYATESLSPHGTIEFLHNPPSPTPR